jgi:hypothetical protein
VSKVTEFWTSENCDCFTATIYRADGANVEVEFHCSDSMLYVWLIKDGKVINAIGERMTMDDADKLNGHLMDGRYKKAS